MRARGDGASWGFVGRRPAGEVELSLLSGLQHGADATLRMGPGRYRTNLEMQMVEVYPEQKRMAAESIPAGLKNAIDRSRFAIERDGTRGINSRA